MERFKDIWKNRKLFYREENYWRRAVSQAEIRAGLVTGVVLSIAVAYVFYNSVLALVLSPVIIYGWMRWWLGERQKIRQRDFAEELRVSLQSLTAALEAGQAFENAMLEVCREKEREGRDQSMVGKEFRIMAQELSMNVPIEQVWSHFAGRCRQQDVREMAMVIGAGKRTGGNLIHVMRRCMVQIAEKMEVHRQIDTVLSARKLELRLMLLMPFVILLYLRVVFGNMISLMYGNLTGVIVMTFCLGLYVAAGVLGYRIVRTAG